MPHHLLPRTRIQSFDGGRHSTPKQIGQKASATSSPAAALHTVCTAAAVHSITQARHHNTQHLVKALSTGGDYCFATNQTPP